LDDGDKALKSRAGPELNCGDEKKAAEEDLGAPTHDGQGQTYPDELAGDLPVYCPSLHEHDADGGTEAEEARDRCEVFFPRTLFGSCRHAESYGFFNR
jgi:hypothetical protein